MVELPQLLRRDIKRGNIMIRSDGSPPLGLLDDPLADWPNDDLLFEGKQRAFIARRHPRAARILDWPELRAMFAAHDPEAARFRTRSRRLGLCAAGLGCLGLLLTALAPLIAQSADGGESAGGSLVPRLLGGLAALFAVAGGLAGYAGVLSGRSKWRWLTHRFWTERMRQLHFQMIVNNLPLAVRAMADEAALRQWRSLRERVLDHFVHRSMEPITETLQRLCEDLAEDQPWLEESWIRGADPPEESSEAAELFDLLRHQRFGIQRRYTSYKLKPGLRSPRTRARALRGAADAMTVLALLLAAATGVALLTGAAADSPALVLSLGLNGALAAIVVTLRVLEEGLQLRSETERYEWYLAAVEALERRYLAADNSGKVAVLREMERLAYQELRWFTTSFSDARFVM